MGGHVGTEPTILKLTPHGDKWSALPFSRTTPIKEHTFSIQYAAVKTSRPIWTLWRTKKPSWFCRESKYVSSVFKLLVY